MPVARVRLGLVAPFVPPHRRSIRSFDRKHQAHLEMDVGTRADARTCGSENVCTRQFLSKGERVRNKSHKPSGTLRNSHCVDEESELEESSAIAYSPLGEAHTNVTAVAWNYTRNYVGFFLASMPIHVVKNRLCSFGNRP